MVFIGIFTARQQCIIEKVWICNVDNYYGIMKAGHVFTIEPMINMGGSPIIEWPDDWTVATKVMFLLTGWKNVCAV